MVDHLDLAHGLKGLARCGVKEIVETVYVASRSSRVRATSRAVAVFAHEEYPKQFPPPHQTQPGFDFKTSR